MGAKILVVDDEPSLLRLTGFSLQSAGFDVVTAETAGDAMEQVQAQSPDLVILDVMLPTRAGSTCAATCVQIRKPRRFR